MQTGSETHENTSPPTSVCVCVCGTDITAIQHVINITVIIHDTDVFSSSVVIMTTLLLRLFRLLLITLRTISTSTTNMNSNIIIIQKALDAKPSNPKGPCIHMSIH